MAAYFRREGFIWEFGGEGKGEFWRVLNIRKN